VQKKSPSINLVKKKVDFVDEFIKWALSIGRLLVILTELVALFTFIYRFSLDRQLIDLHTKIKQEQAIVSAFKEQEDTYRNLQERLAIASDASSTNQNKVKIITDIEDNTPSDITYDSISLFENGIRIQASIHSISSLSEFVDYLKSYKGVSSVSIDKIENKASTATISVGITVLFDKNLNK
jgi:Tfp pilus assembly protein PilN